MIETFGCISKKYFDTVKKYLYNNNWFGGQYGKILTADEV